MHMSPDESPQTAPIKTFKILSLDGGGAKGFYTLGVLDEIEKNSGKPICESFDLIFGTSTGAIIAVLLAKGMKVTDVIDIYREYVPQIMKKNSATGRSKALKELASKVFGDTKVEDFKTLIGIVATNWKEERPMIFKTSQAQAHGSVGSFVPFFGCNVSDAIVASCSAYPFFKTHIVTKANGDVLELGDGGFCANNPTLYAIADATLALNKNKEHLRVVSVGVGAYPTPSKLKSLRHLKGGWDFIRHGFNSDFLQKILGTNTSSMDVLRNILFKSVSTVRIHDTYAEPEMATDLLEYDLAKLNRLTQKGRLSYAAHEQTLKGYLNY